MYIGFAERLVLREGMPPRRNALIKKKDGQTLDGILREGRFPAFAKEASLRMGSRCDAKGANMGQHFAERVGGILRKQGFEEGCLQYLEVGSKFITH